MYEIKLHKRVIKFINSRSATDKKKIKAKLEQLQLNPFPANFNLDIKKLTSSQFFRLRIADYRFLYEVVENEMIIYLEEANNRGDIY